MKTTRRQVLKGLGMGAVVAASGACRPQEWVRSGRTPEPDQAWEGPDPDDTLFPLGIQSGEPLPHAMLFWTRYAGSASLELEAATWDGEKWNPRSPKPVEPADGGFVHATLDGFEPDQPIAFRFRDGDGAVSPTGYGRTALAPDQDGTVVFGVSCCMGGQNFGFPSMAAFVEGGPHDFFLWLGDNVYADDDETVEAFRARWAKNIQTPGFRHVFERIPTLSTWDDHEVEDDWHFDPPPPSRIDMARDAFFEHMAIGRDEDDPNRIWRKFRFGRAVEVFILDCRGERDFENMIYVSDEQLQWLKDSLSQSTAVWKVIGNSVPIATWPEAYSILDKHLDRWEGYPHQRDELLDHILDNDIRGVLFASGDFHHATLAHVEPEGARRKLLEVLGGPGGSNLNPAGRLIHGQSQFPWSDAVWNTLRVQLGTEGLGRLTWVGDEGETLADALIDVDGNILQLSYVRPEAYE